MKITRNAVVEGGLLRPSVPIDLADGQQVVVTIEPVGRDPLKDELLSLAGCIKADVDDVSERCDEYLAESLGDELKRDQ